jgi:hypothetical protein
MALPDEIVLFAEAKNSGEPSDGLMLVYLVGRSGRISADPDLNFQLPIPRLGGTWSSVLGAGQSEAA